MNRIFRDNQSANLRCRRLSGALLNDAISEAHRTKAYLIRERDRLASTVNDFLDENKLRYVHDTCERVFDATFRDNRPRLLRKFHTRMHQETQVQQTNEEEDEDETTAPRQKKINNLSSLELGETSMELLSKGPNFALTQKISESVILEAEKGVERLAYAKRWKDSMKRFRLQALAAAGVGDAITVSGTARPASTDTDTGRADTTPGPTTTATEAGGGVYPEINSRRTTTETETAAARQSPTQSGHADAGPTTTATETGGGVYPEINSRRTTTETETAAARQSPTQSGHADAGPTTTATETGGGVYPEINTGATTTGTETAAYVGEVWGR